MRKGPQVHVIHLTNTMKMLCIPSIGLALDPLPEQQLDIYANVVYPKRDHRNSRMLCALDLEKVRWEKLNGPEISFKN